MSEAMQSALCCQINVCMYGDDGDDDHRRNVIGVCNRLNAFTTVKFPQNSKVSNAFARGQCSRTRANRFLFFLRSFCVFMFP